MFEITVLSRSDAEKFECDRPWAAISVFDRLNGIPKINGVKRMDMIRLSFSDADKVGDVEPAYGMKVEQKNLFCKTQAKQILDFVEKNKDKIEVLMVHCLAGSCRSPAIAAAISKIYTGDDAWYFKAKTPNRLVYRTILEVANERGLI